MTFHHFIITPLNLISSQEFKFQHPEGQHYLYIVSNYRPTNIQHEKILENNSWDKIYWVTNNVIHTGTLGKLYDVFFKKFRINKILNKIKFDDKIILGNFGNNWCKYIAQKSKKNVTLIDDGFATLNYFREYQNNKFEYQNKFLSKIEIYIYNLDIKFKYDIDFFSVFNYPNLKNKIKNHSFESLLQNKINVFYENEFYFLGGPYIRLKIIDEFKYKKIINSIFKDFEKQGITCYYLPHRTEDISIYEWKIINTNIPFEIFFSKLEKRPKHIGSFFSTAVFNAQIMDPNHIKYYFYNLKDNFKNNNQNKLFEYVKNLNKFEVLDV